MPNLTRLMIEQRLEAISAAEGQTPSSGVLGDLAHVAGGNLRKAIFMLQLLAERSLLNDRKNVQLLVTNSTRREVQFVLEEALRGRVHQWEWDRQGEKNMRVLKGAMGALDATMAAHDLDGRGVVDRIHAFLVAGRSHYPEPMLAALLDAVSRCDMRLQHSTQPRIQLEELLHQVAEIGKSQPLGTA
jgi:DNA polymerase III delta prime subunit